MFDRFICCFKPRNVVPPVVKLTTTTKNKNIEEICVRVTDDQGFRPSPDKKTLGLLDTRSLYDSTEWLNNVDKKIELKDTIQFVPPIEKGIVIKVYDGDTKFLGLKQQIHLSSIFHMFII